MVEIDHEFGIEQGCNGGADWSCCPGAVDDRYRMDRLWCVSYMVDDVVWAVGIAFHSRRCAESALAYLRKNGITPTVYHELTDTSEVKRAIIANLLW